MKYILFFIYSFVQIAYGVINTNMIMNQINDFRFHHRVQPLTYSYNMSLYADKHIKYMCSIGTVEQSGGTLYGESIRLIRNQKIDEDIMLMESVLEWYSQIKDYNFDHPLYKLTKETKDFTQMIWAWTSHTGFSSYYCDNVGTFAMIYYDPVGNWRGQFYINVKPIGDVNEPYDIVNFPNRPNMQYPEVPPSIYIKKSPIVPIPKPIPPMPNPIFPIPKPIPPMPKPIVPITMNIPSSPIVYKMLIKYPSLNVSHVLNVLCPSLSIYFNSDCKIELKTTTSIYYGLLLKKYSRDDMKYLLQDNLDEFTKTNMLVCDSSITVLEDLNIVFRYLASRDVCIH